LNISLLRNSEERICSDEQIDALKEQVFLNQVNIPISTISNLSTNLKDFMDFQTVGS